MKRAERVIAGARSWLAGHTGALIIGSVSFCMAWLPSPAWGQWTGGPTGPIYYNGGNVGIGTANPLNNLHVKVGSDLNLGIRSFAGAAGIGSFNDAGNLRVPMNFDASMFTFTSGNVGIGTTSPGRGVIATQADIQIPYAKTDTAVHHALFLGGNDSNPLGAGFYNIGAASAAGRSFNIQATELGTATATLNLNPQGGNVGIGTTAPQYKLAVNGTIGTKEVVVTNTGWADHVFKPEYRLAKLSEVGAYIQQHHRLPEIPSEKEVREKGVGLGEMQIKLLAKIEELTLHAIQAEERNNRLDRQNRELEERIARLEARDARK